MKIAVTGGRNFSNDTLVNSTLDSIHTTTPITTLIHGNCSGADSLCREWARRAGITIISRPADWKQHGRAAGPIRNREMLAMKPDLLVAFPGGRGTADMVGAAKKAGITIHVVVAQKEQPKEQQPASQNPTSPLPHQKPAESH